MLAVKIVLPKFWYTNLKAKNDFGIENFLLKKSFLDTLIFSTIAIIYTTMGGMKAVIWTNVLQDSNLDITFCAIKKYTVHEALTLR